MDELEAVGDPELRTTLLFARGQARPVTADDVAAAHDVHRNVARARLERLVDARLPAPGLAGPAGGRGPARAGLRAPDGAQRTRRRPACEDVRRPARA